MDRRKGILVTFFALFWLLLTAVNSGCGGNRKILTFLFDGVPPESDSAADTLDGTVPSNSASMLRQKRKERADSIAAANRYNLHSPYADGECDACHNMEVESNKGSSIPSLSSDPASGRGWLLAPVEELCISCHDDMSLDYAEENDLNIHAPVAEGMCVTCHNPHRSRNDHLLITLTARELCMQCHDESIPEGEDEHPELEDDDDCTMCHNPHMSTEESLLLE